MDKIKKVVSRKKLRKKAPLLYFLLGYGSCFCLAVIYTAVKKSPVQPLPVYYNHPYPPRFKDDKFQGVDLDYDAKFHNDNHSVADALYGQVKVLVWVMTCPQNLYTKAIHVRRTWGKRANKLLFASDSYDKEFPTIPIAVGSGKNHLTAKTMAAFDYIYENYGNSYDWFMKTDDDTYVVVENLRYFLSDKDPDSPVFFGNHFQPQIRWRRMHFAYHSGGAGYVLSREALRRFGERTMGACSTDYGAEDVQMGLCMNRLDVRTLETTDRLGRTRFHCLVFWRYYEDTYPKWFLKWDKYHSTKNSTARLSDYAISYHYVNPKMMYYLEYLIYHFRAYGISNGLMNLNS